MGRAIARFYQVIDVRGVHAFLKEPRVDAVHYDLRIFAVLGYLARLGPGD